MNAENQRAERVSKLLLETFPEQPVSEGSTGPVKPDKPEALPPPALAAVAPALADHGIRELNSPLSE